MEPERQQGLHKSLVRKLCRIITFCWKLLAFLKSRKSITTLERTLSDTDNFTKVVVMFYFCIILSFKVSSLKMLNCIWRKEENCLTFSNEGLEWMMCCNIKENDSKLVQNMKNISLILYQRLIMFSTWYLHNCRQSLTLLYSKFGALHSLRQCNRMLLNIAKTFLLS